jgi:phosphoribosylamine--glycine ligase
MRVLVVGGGAREHALVWKLAAERDAGEVICAPGNAGIARIARCVPIDPADPDALLQLARRELVDLTIVGPEKPLAAGVADRFADDHRLLFGPRRAAAELESSKAFAKDFMSRHGIPTARYAICRSVADGLTILNRDDFGYPVVLKADGLAAGKGVVIAQTRAEAEAAISAAMVARRFGEAGARLVVEEHLSGPEVSFFAVCDGTHAVPLVSAQDHKRAFDDDRGPNTGGMGAVAPSPLMDRALHERVMTTIVEPVMAGLAAEERPYRGFLYVGLMLTPAGPRVIEFNVRLGDPEAQVVLPMIEGNLLPMLAGAAAGDVGRSRLQVRDEPHVGVVMASGGYPGAYATGKAIEGLEVAEAMTGVIVFHAGTARRDGRLETSGGRVLTVVGHGSDVGTAIDRAYAAVGQIRFEGSHVRTDIGRRAR